MKSISIVGKVANSYQLIGAVAAKYKIAKEENANVNLKLTYIQYWNSVNISTELLEYIASTSTANKGEKVIELQVNNNYKIRQKSKIVIDDGIGAYRRNIFELFRVSSQERVVIGAPKRNVKESIKFISINLRKLIFSINQSNHISIFNKSLCGYFEPSKVNIPFFINAISELSRCFTGLDPIPDDSIILVTQPRASLGFKTDLAYSEFLRHVLLCISKKFPNKKILIKKHPLDTFTYDYEDSYVIQNDCPIEILLFNNNNTISSLIGFCSTSLLTCKILFGLSSFYIIPPERKSVTNDFWVNKAFTQHAKELKIKYS